MSSWTSFLPDSRREAEALLGFKPDQVRKGRRCIRGLLLLVG